MLCKTGGQERSALPQTRLPLQRAPALGDQDHLGPPVFKLDPDSISAEAPVDGLHTIRTSLSELTAVEAHACLVGVERAFRTSKD